MYSVSVLNLKPRGFQFWDHCIVPTYVYSLMLHDDLIMHSTCPTTEQQQQPIGQQRQPLLHLAFNLSTIQILIYCPSPT